MDIPATVNGGSVAEGFNISTGFLDHHRGQVVLHGQVGIDQGWIVPYRVVGNQIQGLFVKNAFASSEEQ